MFKLIAAALLSLSLAWSPVKSNTEVTMLARFAGCHARVVTSDKVSTLKSFYDTDIYVLPWGQVIDGGEPTLYVGTASEEGVTYDMQLAVALHEIGHCQQHQEKGTEHIYDVLSDIKSVELDADRRSSQLMCDLGRSGPAAWEDLMLWAHLHKGYSGDPYHGSLEERIDAAHAVTCPQNSSRTPAEAA